MHFFLNAIEKTSINIESTMLGIKNTTRVQALIKELNTRLSGLQLQLSCLSSIEKALENITDTCCCLQSPTGQKRFCVEGSRT